MFNITPVHNSKLDCFQDSIAAIASYYKADYQLMLLNNWGFSFEPESVKNGKRLSSEKINNLNFLSVYHGIEVIFREINKDNVIDLLQLQVVNKPVAVMVDSYYIPWDKSYKVLHNYNHVFIITKINYIKQEVWCADPFYELSLKVLPFKDFKQALNGYMEFNRIEISFDKYNWRKLVSKCILDDNYRNNFEDMYCFADQIHNYFDEYKTEVKKYKNLWHFPLIFILGKIALGRLSFSVALEYLMTKYNEDKLSDIIQEFTIISDNWSMIRRILAKGFLTDNSDEICEKIYLKILLTAEMEKKIYQTLCSLL